MNKRTSTSHDKDATKICPECTTNNVIGKK